MIELLVQEIVYQGWNQGWGEQPGVNGLVVR